MLVSKAHTQVAVRILGESREAQVEALLLEALRRVRPAGPADYAPLAKELAMEVMRGRVLSVPRVRQGLMTYFGVERRAGAVVAYWAELG